MTHFPWKTTVTVFSPFRLKSLPPLSYFRPHKSDKASIIEACLKWSSVRVARPRGSFEDRSLWGSHLPEFSLPWPSLTTSLSSSLSPSLPSKEASATTVMADYSARRLSEICLDLCWLKWRKSWGNGSTSICPLRSFPRGGGGLWCRSQSRSQSQSESAVLAAESESIKCERL